MEPVATTFVRAEPNNFRELVQKLTGAPEDSPEKLPVTTPARPSSKTWTPGEPTGVRRSPFKLQERRHTMRKLEIQLGLTSIRNSTSRMLRLSSPIPSPVTPLRGDSPLSSSSSSEEEKAIAEKGFYLHPSPLNTPRGSDPPELLTLFPLTSPK